MTSRQNYKGEKEISAVVAELFGAGGEDVFALDLDFYADGGTDVATLDDGAANPEIAGKIGGFERIEQDTGAGIADQRMSRGFVAVFLAQLIEVTNIFQLAGAVDGLA